MIKKNIIMWHFGKNFYIKLNAPESYWDLDNDEKKRICNGCGAAGAMFDYVPDKIWFLPISEACNIHDFMYHVGETVSDKKEADDIFFENISIIIKTCTKTRLLKLLRLRMAYTYYLAVQMYGNEAFEK